MADHPKWLPELLPWQGNDACDPNPAYEDLLYAAYERDFVNSRPTFRGVDVRPKRDPEHNGRCGTFWHCISQTIGDGRLIRPKRCERIQWIRAMLDAADDPFRVTVYGVMHEPNELRYEIALTDFSYVVILAERSDHYLLWTAFEHEKAHGQRKAKKKYEAWLEAQKKLKPPSP